MFKKILYPTDLSEVSEKALRYVEDLKGAGAEEVVILHIIDERELDAILRAAPWFGKSQEEMEKDVVEKVKEDLKEKLRSIVDRLENRGYKVKVRIEVGTPFREILRVEEEEDVSLIVMASHGKSNIVEMLLGSVSERVVRRSKKPVLLIKRE